MSAQQSTAKKSTAKKTATRKAPATKTAARRATGKTTTVKKSARTVPAKKTAARRAAGKPTTAKKPARPAPAKKTAAGKKTTAKKSARTAPVEKPTAKQPTGTAAAIAAITARAAAHGVVLPKGASPAAIARAEQILGFALPDEVRAWYAAHDGGGGYVLEEREFLSLAGVITQWKIWKRLLDQGTFAANDHGAPGEGVQKKWWIAEWVPVTYDGAGNHHVIDLAPARGGAVGQVLSFWHDDASRTVVASGLLAWLARARWTP